MVTTPGGFSLSTDQSQLASVMDALYAHAVVSVTDPDGIIRYANQHFCELSGYAEDELVGQSHRIVQSGQHDAAFFKELWDTISSGRHWHGDICNRRKDGSLYWVNSIIAPMLDARGDIQHYIAIRTDITHDRQNEERLRRSQAFANIGTWDWDIQTGELFWSERIAPLFGYSEGELETSYDNFLKTVHPEDRQSLIDAVNACVEGAAEYNIEHRCVWPDGSVRWLLEKGDVVRDQDDIPLRMLGVVQDVTERVQLEERLALKTRLLDAVRMALLQFVSAASFDQVSSSLLDKLIALTDSTYGFIGVIHQDEQGQPYLKTHALTDVAWDQQTRELYEQTQGRGLEFRNLDTLFGAAIRSGELVISNDTANDERAGGRPPGHPDLNSFMGVPVYYGDKLVALYGLANRPGGYDHEIAGQLDVFNASYGVLVHAQEIAQAEAQSRAETEQARRQAEKASQAKSEFLSAMSHELRTPLNAISGFAQLLSVDPALNSEQQDNVREILNAGQHLLDLINEVLDLSRVEAGHLDLAIKPLELDGVLEDCCHLLMPQINARELEVSCDSGDQGLKVLADSTRLKQVFINLLSNAVKYNRDGGSIHVSRQPIGDGRVRITVADTGVGIATDAQAGLFQAFHRLPGTRDKVEGTGIGLAIVKQLVEAMQGTIDIQSTPGEGSCFGIELPVAHDQKGTTP